MFCDWMEFPVSNAADKSNGKGQVPEDIAGEQYLICPTRLPIWTSKGKMIFDVDQLATESAYHNSLPLIIHSSPKTILPFDKPFANVTW